MGVWGDGGEAGSGLGKDSQQSGDTDSDEFRGGEEGGEVRHSHHNSDLQKSVDDLCSRVSALSNEGQGEGDVPSLTTIASETRWRRRSVRPCSKAVCGRKYEC